jgi:dTDP-L-rhamnose 4-epimerase
VLGFVPQVEFRDGLDELAEYLADQIADDQAERATSELLQRGLVA